MAIEHTRESRWLTGMRYLLGLGLGVAAEWVGRLLSLLGHAVHYSLNFLKLAVAVQFKSLPSSGQALTSDAMRDIGVAIVCILIFAAMAVAQTSSSRKS